MDLTADELNAMSPGSRQLYVAKQREAAAVDAKYQRSSLEFRNRMLDEWMVPETKQERWAREDAEAAAQQEADRNVEWLVRQTEQREQREHELAMARTWAKAYVDNNGNGSNDADGLAWGEIFSGLNDVLVALSGRLDGLDQRVTKLEAANDATSSQLQTNATRAETTALQTRSELKADIRALKADVNAASVRLDLLATKKLPQQPPQHIIVSRE
jgi:hypothetical protein